jgi:hypothetical protein
MAIIKDSNKLRTVLHNRLKEIYPSNRGHGFNNAAVIKDADERKFKIAPEALSRYISGKSDKGSLSEAQLVWLAYRYYIPIQLNIGVPVVKDNRIVFEIPKYDELKALTLLNQIFK